MYILFLCFYVSLGIHLPNGDKQYFDKWPLVIPNGIHFYRLLYANKAFIVYVCFVMHGRLYPNKKVFFYFVNEKKKDSQNKYA